ncbi:MAG: hypothetical protein H7222_11640 [Methylotenera sp.]|nr:hypothetical protein [Oligoflexia bacterium]
MKIKTALTFLAPLAISLGLITDLSPARAEEPAGKPVGEKELSEKLRF